MKKTFFTLCLFMCVTCICTGCSDGSPDSQLSKQTAGADQGQVTMKSLPELRKEAQNLNVEYENLNLSDTVITIPEVDEISSLIFPVSIYSLEQQTEKFEKNIRTYAGLDENVDLTPYMNIMYWDLTANDRLVIPYNEATPEQLEQIQYLSYNDGSNSELLIFSNYMLEMGNYELPTALSGDTGDYSGNAYGYRGIYLGTPVETYHLPEDDISGVTWHLSDGDTSLADAVSYVEKHIGEDYYFVGSDLLDYHVFEAEVRQLNDSVYYYQFRIYPSYNGIPLNKDSGVEIDEASGENSSPDMAVFGDVHKVSMFQSDQLGFIWSSCHSYESVEPQESYSELISLEDACTLLSRYISVEKEFSVGSIELIYQTELQYENEEKREWGYVQSIYCHPVYHFIISNPGISGYESIYFDVDALTGKIVTVTG